MESDQIDLLPLTVLRNLKQIDETQETFYPAVMRAIVETGFKGFVAQEFVPTRPDALASLRQGIQICDV